MHERAKHPLTREPGTRVGGASLKRRLFLVLLATSSLALGLVLVEVTLRVVQSERRALEGTLVGRLNRYMEAPFSWENYFQQHYEKNGSLVYEGLHRPHETRGWALKPNLSVKRGMSTYTTNSAGFRSLYEFMDDPQRYGVLVVGDSATFGDEIDDHATWPYLLQQKDPRLQVMNMGGSGYGVDQMYLTLAQQIESYRPRLIVAGYISDDLDRSLLPFRDYKKPRFVLRDDRLVLTNVPIGDVDQIYREIGQRIPYRPSWFRTVDVFRSILGKWKAARERYALNEKLFEGMHEIARQNGAEFLLIYLPWGEEIVFPDLHLSGEDFFVEYSQRHEHPLLNPRKQLLAGGFAKSWGHYRIAENRLIGALVYERIQQLPSWNAFVREAREREGRAEGRQP